MQITLSQVLIESRKNDPAFAGHDIFQGALQYLDWLLTILWSTT